MYQWRIQKFRKKRGAPPEKAKNSPILGLKSWVLLTFYYKFWAKRGGGPGPPPILNPALLFRWIKYCIRDYHLRFLSQHYTFIHVHRLGSHEPYVAGPNLVQVLRGSVLQQVLHIEDLEPSLLYTISAKHISKLAALSPVMLTATPDSLKSVQAAINN
jgi:hypothetical protein